MPSTKKTKPSKTTKKNAKNLLTEMEEESSDDEYVAPDEDVDMDSSSSEEGDAEGDGEEAGLLSWHGMKWKTG